MKVRTNDTVVSYALCVARPSEYRKIMEGAEMTIEEYKTQPFKDATIGVWWSTFDRRDRREIERLVKKGKNPDIMKYV